MTTKTQTITVYRQPPFACDMTSEDVTICVDDRCQHNSHPAGVTLYTLTDVQFGKTARDERDNDTLYTTFITAPDGSDWLYMETWAGNPYPVNTRWRSVETGETY